MTWLRSPQRTSVGHAIAGYEEAGLRELLREGVVLAARPDEGLPARIDELLESPDELERVAHRGAAAMALPTESIVLDAINATLALP